tara:strand:- start:801 stop:1019 length:219 start_codon:yes stop_codon:yes gene_type:complete
MENNKKKKKFFRDIPFTKDAEKLSKNPDLLSKSEVEKKMLYGSAETFITRLKMKLLYSGIDESTTTFINKFR